MISYYALKLLSLELIIVAIPSNYTVENLLVNYQMIAAVF